MSLSCATFALSAVARKQCATPSPMPELSVVIPLHNEASLAREVVSGWLGTLELLGVDFEMLLYNDGSTDGTGEILDRLAAVSPALKVVHQTNRGHGPTILRGYMTAAGTWVLQADGDGEVSASFFADLWQKRERFDLLIGCRTGRGLSPARNFLTAAARATVGVAFGTAIRDVNSPFRLMRGEKLREAVPSIPPETFAPNVILSGLAVSRRWRIYQANVPHRPRDDGAGLQLSPRFWRSAAQSCAQTFRVALSEATGR